MPSTLLEPRTEPRNGIAALLAGLLDDIKRLVAQELRLARREIQQELSKAKRAAVMTGIGIGFVGIGGLLLVIMLVHLLQSLTGLPLWAAYGIVGALLGLTGVFLLSKGRGTASDVNLMPQRTVETLKENVTWVKEQATSGRT